MIDVNRLILLNLPIYFYRKEEREALGVGTMTAEEEWEWGVGIDPSGIAVSLVAGTAPPGIAAEVMTEAETEEDGDRKAAVFYEHTFYIFFPPNVTSSFYSGLVE